MNILPAKYARGPGVPQADFCEKLYNCTYGLLSPIFGKEVRVSVYYATEKEKGYHFEDKNPSLAARIAALALVVFAVSLPLLRVFSGCAVIIGTVGYYFSKTHAVFHEKYKTIPYAKANLGLEQLQSSMLLRPSSTQTKSFEKLLEDVVNRVEETNVSNPRSSENFLQFIYNLSKKNKELKNLRTIEFNEFWLDVTKGPNRQYGRVMTILQRVKSIATQPTDLLENIKVDLKNDDQSEFFAIIFFVKKILQSANLDTIGDDKSQIIRNWIKQIEQKLPTSAFNEKELGHISLGKLNRSGKYCLPPSSDLIAKFLTEENLKQDNAYFICSFQGAKGLAKNYTCAFYNKEDGKYFYFNAVGSEFYSVDTFDSYQDLIKNMYNLIPDDYFKEENQVRLQFTAYTKN